ncbi:16S rRNA (guanine(966)-N(2))-methyltransferase RsmD [Spongiibacter sp.]|uniref:16S rRNA (guanine(966)-N(2))-methyltransferase RsmD n=1 Tax=Spongiibacter sp. TaxID=2024860 RepID=UPI0035685CF4
MSPRSKSSRRATDPRKSGDGVVRIIGGQWRSRKLPFHNAEGLRPSGDRVRETLFNWLAPLVPGAHCLDLFAGSGALGLEALSRGAARCDFVDNDSASAMQIRMHLATLNCRDGEVHSRSADSFLQARDADWHIVFLDPPFNKGLLQPALDQLAGRLSDGARVYVETARGEAFLVPAGWLELKHKTAGQVEYRLYEVVAPVQ